MLFLRTNIVTHKQHILGKVPLRKKQRSLYHSPMIPPIVLNKLKQLLRRVSLWVSQESKASMTVEAALILPLFLFLMLSVLSILEIIRLQSAMAMALRETGTPMAVYGYAYDRMQANLGIDVNGIIGDIGFSYGYAGNRVKQYLGEEYLAGSPLCGPLGGIQYLGSNIMGEDDIIDLVAWYQVQPDINMAAIPPIRLFSRFYARAWTGYALKEESGTQKEGEITVYITPEGTVYHLSRSCSHLKRVIQTVRAEELFGLRNENGEKYRFCIVCGIGGNAKRYFITRQGDCYHSSIKCPGLKRTIIVIPLSQAGGRSSCSRCGG